MTEVYPLRQAASRAPAVTKAVAVLEALAAAREPVGLSELARRLGLAKSTVANLCTALEEARMVRRTGDGVLLGYKVLELSKGFRTATDLSTEFLRLSADLPVASAETVLLGVLDEVDVVYLARHEGRQPVRLASDHSLRMPAVITALGKTMLAQLPGDERERRLASIRTLPTPTARSHRTFTTLRSDLKLVRERGYAVDDGENIDGVSCVAVTVPGWTDVPAAVCATLLSSRATPDLCAELVADLRALADQLSRLAAL